MRHFIKYEIRFASSSNRSPQPIAHRPFCSRECRCPYIHTYIRMLVEKKLNARALPKNEGNCWKGRGKRMGMAKWKWMRNGHGRVNQATDIDLNDLTFDQKVRRKAPRTEAESAAASEKKEAENIAWIG